MTEPATSIPPGELCGVWIDDDGRARLAVSTPDSGREVRTDAFRPFAWLGNSALVGGGAVAMVYLRPF